MKKLNLILVFTLCSIFSTAKVNFVDSRALGNIDYNSLEFIRSRNISELLVSGATTGTTDVSLNSSVQMLLNANSLQDVFWMNASGDIQNTLQSAFMEGTAYDFIQDMEVIRNGSYKAIYGANCGAGVVNAPLGPPVNFSSVGSLIFGTDFSDVVTAMIKLESSSGCGVTQTKPAQNDWLISGSYGGNLSLGGPLFSSTGTRDGFIGSWNPSTGNSNWFGEIKAFGYNSVDRIYYNESSNEIVACGQLTNSGTYTVNGTNTALTTSPVGNSVFLMRLDASTGAYLNHTVFGSSSNVNPFGLFESTSGVFFAGNMNDNVYPDPADLSKVEYSRGSVDKLVLKYDANFQYQAGRVFGSAEVDFGKSFRKFSNSQNDRIAIAGAYTLTSRAVIDQQASVFIIDESLNLIDSILFGGKGYDSANDVDVDSLGFMFVVGAIQDTADMDPGPGLFNLISAGGYDAYISRFDATSLGMSNHAYVEPELIVFPVPVSDALNVQWLLNSPSSGNISIYNLRGQRIYYNEFSRTEWQEEQIDISTYSNGVYTLELASDAGLIHRKIIVSR